MTNKKINLAVIGAGYWGKNLIRIFAQLNVLSKVCDSSRENLKLIKQAFPQLDFCTSYNKLLNDKTINAVVIATPAVTHYELAKSFLLAGKDVFVEKPLSLKLEEGKELIELARKNKRILMVGHILEYHPGIQKLKQLIDAGELGQIRYVYSNRLNLGKIRKEENILWSFAPHDISIILLLLKQLPESVAASGGSYLHHDVADVTVSNLSFSNGVRGHIFVSWLHPYKEQKLVVVGDKKMAVFNDTAKEDKLLIYNHKIGWVKDVPVTQKEKAQAIAIEEEEPLLREAKHYLECLKTRTKPQTSGESALQVLKVLQACQYSLENRGETVMVNQEAVCENQKDYFVHPSSFVGKNSKVGKGSKIWHYSHIMDGAKIGKDCVIGQNVFIGKKAIIGDNVKVQNNVSIYDCVELEKDVFCGPSVVFTNVINPRSFIERKKEFKKTLVKKGATLGANATIICGNTVGEYAFIGAGAVVTKNISAYSLAYGNPAKVNGFVCKCGVKLTFKKSRLICIACGKAYKTGRANTIKELK